MRTITTNYGLAGDTLDATDHIEAALSRLCTPSEIASCRRCEFEVAVATQPGKAKAALN